MNWKHYTLIILIVLNLVGAVRAQDALSLPPCDEELVAVLKNEQNKEESVEVVPQPDQPHNGMKADITQKTYEPKIDIHDLTMQVTTHSKDVNCIFEHEGSIYSPLLFAVCMENPDAVKVLLRQGADPNFIQPVRNVTPLARVGWKAANKDPSSKLWKDHFRMAADLIDYGADEDYKFIVDQIDYVNGVQTVKEIHTSIKTMSPKLIKDVHKYQSNDFMGRTPQAKAAMKAQAERNRKKAEKARLRKAQKVVF